MSGSVPAKDKIPVIFVRNFPSYPCQPRLTLPALVNSRWRTESGSSYKLVTEIDINVMLAATTQFSIYFHRYRHRPTSENSIRYKPEVETVLPQTLSTNNLATETDFDAIAVAIPMFHGVRFSLMFMPTQPNASFTQKFQNGGRTPKVVITL